MTSEICANCGYEKSWHPILPDSFIKKGCEKFILQKKEWNDFYAPKSRYIPQNHSPKTKSLVDHSEASQGLNKCVGVTPENKTEDTEPEELTSTKTFKTSGSNDASSLSDKIKLITDKNNQTQIVIKASNVKGIMKWIMEMIEFELQPVTLGKSIARRLNDQIKRKVGSALI